MVDITSGTVARALLVKLDTGDRDASRGDCV
jgi:hypothetical protein